MGTEPDAARELLPLIFFGFEETLKNNTDVAQTAVRRDFRPKPMPSDVQTPVKIQDEKAGDDTPKASLVIVPVDGSGQDSNVNPNPESPTSQSESPVDPATAEKEKKDPGLLETSIG